MSDNLFMSSAQAYRPLAAPYEAVSTALQQTTGVTTAAAGAVVSLESRNSLGAQDTSALSTMRANFKNLFMGLHDKLAHMPRHDKSGAVQVSEATLEARSGLGFTGALMAEGSNLQVLAGQKLANPPATAYGAKAVTVEARGNAFHDTRSIYTAEAFQNYDLQASRVFSALFNYSIVDFDDFTRTFWRPVTISPDSSFVELLVNVLTVFNGYEHNKDGKHNDWRRHNLVRAIADHTILHTDLTKAIPAYATENADLFSAKIGQEVIQQAERDVTTGPLLSPASGVDYIGLCMPDWLVKTGVPDQRSNLDPGVRLDTVNIALAADILSFKVLGEPMTEFNGSVQGDRQLETLSWTTSALIVNAKSTNIDKTPLVDLESVVTGDLTLAIRIDIQAEINLETGELTFNNGIPQIRYLKDTDGNTIAKTDSRYTTIATALKGVTEVSFKLEAFRSNADRRQRGQLINIRQFAENVVVPWRDPIAVERPAAGDATQDTSDLTALMTATRVRIANEGITALLDAEVQLERQTVDPATYDSISTPATMGIGRHYVLPYYSHEKLDMLDIVDSLKSSERAADIQAAIVATMRNRLAVAYTDSQYKAASDALSGGTAPKPKVAVVTDPVTARYIIEPGELRTMVDFELIVVPVLDLRMRGKLKMVFVTDDGGNDVNYLNWGYLFWSPEHVLVANMSRTGGFNRETQMQPRYRHYVACPVMISIDVENIAEALVKMPIKVDTTP